MPENSKAERSRNRKNALPKVKQSYTQVRIDDETFMKGKILAAIYDELFNHIMVRAIRNEIHNYDAQQLLLR